MFFYKFPESDIRDIKHKPSSTSMSSTTESLTYLTAIRAVFYAFIKREPNQSGVRESNTLELNSVVFIATTFTSST